MAYMATSLHRPLFLFPSEKSTTSSQVMACHANNLKSVRSQAEKSMQEQFSFGEYASTKLRHINRALDKAVPLREPLKINESMRYTLVAPAKRVIPILTIASCELFGGEESSAMPAACAIEMVIAMSFIHDDLPCMDNDDFRRGQPSNHRAFGENVALLSGCALYSLALQHVAECTVGVPGDKILRMVVELGKAFGSQGMLGGQVVDMELEGKASIGLSDLKYLHETKSATFFEAGAVCGALAGGGRDAEVERLRNYAKCIGLMYQVMDDVLDVESTSEELGKTAGKDFSSDKATYPKLLGIDGARDFARELVEHAVEELAGFDPIRAAPLYHLAQSIPKRRGKGRFAAPHAS